MNNNINLVTNNTADLVKGKKRLKQVRIVAIIGLIIVSLFSVIIFVVNLQSSLSSIKKDENSTIQSISYLNKKAAKLAVVNNRLADISDILKKRKDYTEIINVFQKQMPSGIKIQSFAISKKEISLTVRSDSLITIDNFLNNMIGLSSKKDTIGSLLINSINLDQKTGLFSLSLKTSLL